MPPKADIEAQKIPQASFEPTTVSEETSPEIGKSTSGLANPRTRRFLIGFLLFLLSNVVLALGQSATIPVNLAAWTPAGVSWLIGASLLLYLEDG